MHTSGKIGKGLAVFIGDAYSKLISLKKSVTLTANLCTAAHGVRMGYAHGLGQTRQSLRSSPTGSRTASRKSPAPKVASAYLCSWYRRVPSLARLIGLNVSRFLNITLRVIPGWVPVAIVLLCFFCCASVMVPCDGKWTSWHAVAKKHLDRKSKVGEVPIDAFTRLFW